MIQVQNLTKYFGKIKAVDRLTFDVKEGEILGLLGPNGAGKTTTMRLLTGFLTPTEGEVLINGLDTERHSKKIRSLIGYLPEDVPLYKDSTVDSFLRFVADVKSVKKKKQAIDEVVELCKIGEVRKRIIGKLSKGYRQRVGLAQALLGKPKILILDEPTSGLDPRQINEIRELIKGLRGQQTVLLSTHILPEVSAVSDRVLIINQGKLVAAGTPDELAEKLRSGNEIAVTIRGDFKIIKPVLHRVPGVVSVEKAESLGPEVEVYRISCEKGQDMRSSIAHVLIDSGFELLELKSAPMTLEDIFLKLVTTEETVPQTEAPASGPILPEEEEKLNV